MAAIKDVCEVDAEGVLRFMYDAYLHSLNDLWTYRWHRKATGDVIVTRLPLERVVPSR
jgi:hypothetical protein